MRTDNSPLVSIVINNYNYARFLAEAIDSALSQTYTKTEVIVVDDGSEDNSCDVIKAYGDRVIPILKKNGGQASALNEGYRHSKGEIVCLLDADDFWTPEKVSCVVSAFQRQPNASVIYHKVQNIDEARQPLDRPWPHIVIQGNIAKKVAKTGGWWPFAPSTGLSFSRRFLSQVMDIPEKDYRICADTYLADLAPFFGDVVGIKRSLSMMRIHNSNNWSHPEQSNRRAVHYHELRIKHLNEVLTRLHFKREISLLDNLAYQETRFRLGERDSLRKLILLILRNPFDWRLHSRIKSAVSILLEGNGIKPV